MLVGLRQQEPELRPAQNKNRRVYLWVLLVASLVILSLVAQSRLTRKQDHVFFHNLPQRRATTSVEASQKADDKSVDRSVSNVESKEDSQIQNNEENPTITRGSEQDSFTFAIAHLLRGDVDYSLDLYTILISTFVQRKAGSRAKVVLYITGASELPPKDENLLQKFQIQAYFIESADTDTERDQTLRLDVFHRMMSDLIAYDRILYMNANIVARGSMDYLYRASKSGQFQENILFADRQSPATTNIFMVRPTNDITNLDHSMFHPDNGWGHAFQSGEHYDLINGRSGSQWDFIGADDTPGLLYHYARFERGRVSIVLQDFIHSMAVDEDEETTFESLVSLKDRQIAQLAEFSACWQEQMDHLPCQTPHNTFFRFDYKPRPEDLSLETANTSPAHFWHRSLDELNAEYHLDLDPSALISNKKAFGAQFAYAFIVGGCDPENDGSYKGFIWQVLMNAYILREAKSSSDVILFVQMSSGSKADKLPEEDLIHLRSMNIQVRYIEKYDDESFDSIIMDKFRVLQLYQYEKIMFCDSDVLLRGSLDYIFELSTRGVLKSNVVFATDLVPSTGHLFMVSPLDGDWDHIMEISEQSGKFWNDIEGWGHSFSGLDGYDLTSGVIGTKWDFPGSFCQTSLIYINFFQAQMLTRVFFTIG